MRTLLQLVSARAYPTIGSFIDEARALIARKPIVALLQTEHVAAGCAKAIAGEGLALFFAHATDAPCHACTDSFTCYRCDGEGLIRKRGRACPYCEDGACFEGTGGEVVYKTLAGKVVLEPYKVLAWRKRQPAVFAKWCASVDWKVGADGVKALARHPCSSCNGTGAATPIIFGLCFPRHVELVHGTAATRPEWAHPTNEDERAFGRRRPGSWWLAAHGGPADEEVAAALEAGHVESKMELERVGSLLLLPSPRPVYRGPRFRGVGEWSNDGERRLGGAARRSARAPAQDQAGEVRGDG